MPTFTWVPSYDTSVTRKPKVLVSPYGDGYEQRVGDGVNNSPAVWSVSFDVLQQAAADALDAFLTARNGAESFTWIPPDGVSGSYVCREWSRSVTGPNTYSISANFEQVFE